MFVLAARVDKDRVAVPLNMVDRVERAAALTPVPGLPFPLSGSLNYHGHLVAAASLAQVLAGTVEALRPDQFFVFVDTGRRKLALIVDAVDGLLRLPGDCVRNPEIVGSTTRRMRGVAILPDGLIVVVDPEKFLSPEEEEQTNAALSTRA